MQRRVLVASLGMGLNQPFRTCDPLGSFWRPHLTKHKDVTKTNTEPFAQTLGFRDILERLACLSLRMFLSQPFRVCEAEYV